MSYKLSLLTLLAVIGCLENPTSPPLATQQQPCKLAIEYVNSYWYDDTTYTIFKQTPTEQDILWIRQQGVELWYFSWADVIPTPDNPNVPVYQLGKCYYYHPF